MKQGWSYLSPAECLALRGSERALLLDNVLRDHLAAWRFAYRGVSHALSVSGIAQVLKAINDIGLNEGLTPANERVWKHLVLGVTVHEFMPDGHKHSVTVPLLDFAEPARNRLQVTEELSVEREGGHGRFRPDIVLYVNGIPLAVIEAKRPTGSHAEKLMLAEGVSQHLRNQKPDGIPALYAYAQLLLSISGQDGKYATTETPSKFWAMWREEEIPAADIDAIVNARLTAQQHSALFAERPAHVRAFFNGLWSKPVAATDRIGS
ncbi:type I restriction endonuclease [Mesorhizobium sp.]|uniref:type I restriction endonuclease n=1 Tax=Mesorhizobium sp. TaxID=1871066 RepID=UPI00257DBD82|nr:type I restriction endonuclease [Mesorhizobium sp.]